jgi:hypothetical protein
MPRSTWIASLYGYLVCVIAVITLLVSVSGFIDAAFDRSNPLLARGGWGGMGAPLTSFEAYRASMYYRETVPGRAVVVSDQVGSAPARPLPPPSDTLTTEQLRARYEALRADRIAQVSFSATQNLVKDGLLIILAIALFAWHWRWIRSQRETAEG